MSAALSILACGIPVGTVWECPGTTNSSAARSQLRAVSEQRMDASAKLGSFCNSGPEWLQQRSGCAFFVLGNEGRPKPAPQLCFVGPRQRHGFVWQRVRSARISRQSARRALPALTPGAAVTLASAPLALFCRIAAVWLRSAAIQNRRGLCRAARHRCSAVRFFRNTLAIVSYQQLRGVHFDARR
jgi:hypothetical protein